MTWYQWGEISLWDRIMNIFDHRLDIHIAALEETVSSLVGIDRMPNSEMRRVIKPDGSEEMQEVVLLK